MICCGGFFFVDPRERVKEDDLDVVLSPQRRSFGGGCHVTAAVSSRRSGSPLDNKENESLRLMGGRRIGSGRIIPARGYERDLRDKDLREPREAREKEYKDKRFRVRPLDANHYYKTLSKQNWPEIPRGFLVRSELNKAEYMNSAGCVEMKHMQLQRTPSHSTCCLASKVGCRKQESDTPPMMKKSGKAFPLLM